MRWRGFFDLFAMSGDSRRGTYVVIAVLAVMVASAAVYRSCRASSHEQALAKQMLLRQQQVEQVEAEVAKAKADSADAALEKRKKKREKPAKREADETVPITNVPQY
ncbi:MAG: hypothetical protein ACI308_06370 [Muribaculaceae bacterium]